MRHHWKSKNNHASMIACMTIQKNNTSTMQKQLGGRDTADFISKKSTFWCEDMTHTRHSQDMKATSLRNSCTETSTTYIQNYGKDTIDCSCLSQQLHLIFIVTISCKHLIGPTARHRGIPGSSIILIQSM